MCHGYWDARWRDWRAERREPEVKEIRDPEVRDDPVEPVADEELAELLRASEREEAPA